MVSAKSILQSDAFPATNPHHLSRLGTGIELCWFAPLMAGWKDRISNDMREKGLREQDIQDRGRWKRLTRNSDPI